MDFGQDILDEFVIESREHFEHIEDEILELSRQKESPDRELVDKIFRSIHSVKGAAGFLGLDQIGRLTHVMETLLSMVRSDKMKPETYFINSLLAGVDILNIMLEDVDQSNEVDISSVYDRLNDLLKGADYREVRNDLKTDICLENPDEWEAGLKINRLALKNLPSAHRFLYILKYDLLELSKTLGKSPVLLIRELLDIGEIVDSKIEVCSRDLSEGLPEGPLKYFVLYSTSLTPDIIKSALQVSENDIIPIDKEKLLDTDAGSLNINSVIMPSVLPEQAVSEPHPSPIPKDRDQQETAPAGDASHSEIAPSVLPKQAASERHRSSVPKDRHQQKAAPAGAASQSEERHDIRVDLEKVDLLINLVGELVIAESMVTNNPDLAGLELENFEHSAQNLRRITSDLQDVAMSMRMIPLSKTFRKTVRLVYDLSNKVGKKCKVELIGEETEVDKTVIEHITDPMLHIIRNCVDHGIESPEERKAAGKPQSGVITIEAKHEGGEVLIRISDDGRGLNRENILEKAMRVGMLKGNKDYCSDQDIFRLIFEPGFSTAGKITDVSGRGVGLDVVKRNLEKLKGRTDVRSVPGKGTSMILRIPLTLAIIDGMVVRVGTASYTIPMLSIRESFRPDFAQITAPMDEQEVVKVRDKLISVVRLHKLYNIVPRHTELHKGILINVTSGNRSVCLFADEIIGHHQTVIKGMPSYVASARGISGCTIMDNGDVSLILDVGSIIDMSERDI
ncbi:chemotaxis protein CheA [Desulfonema magnum]|uniref:Chemotaxis protein CheA n=1 Tax=Desulfonema magnum TaxID=45655 RepID=A0A975BNA9_9BACT|nr:chemotaxis protein CheA [Desulfonema magnum]QTA88643.1 Two component system histidine kinase, Hpt domain-containing [Desulfonema magnum]